MSNRLKKVIVILCMVIFITGALSILWNEAYRHYLPPQAAKSTFLPGDTITFDQLGIPQHQTSYIHFFDGSCLFSRTNIDHLKFFIDQYENEFAFYVLITDNISNESFREKYDLPSFVQIISQVDREVFATYGVTATPYAMITLDDNTLYFQGNYTLNNGLCGATNINQSAPAIALRFVSNNQPSPLFPAYQQSNWGCHL